MASSFFTSYNGHLSPHFHARYQDQEMLVEIESSIVHGKMSRRALQMIFEWSDKYKNELLRNWQLSRERKPLEPISPIA